MSQAPSLPGNTRSLVTYLAPSLLIIVSVVIMTSLLVVTQYVSLEPELISISASRSALVQRIAFFAVQLQDLDLADRAHPVEQILFAAVELETAQARVNEIVDLLPAETYSNLALPGRVIEEVGRFVSNARQLAGQAATQQTIDQQLLDEIVSAADSDLLELLGRRTSLYRQYAEGRVDALEKVEIFFGVLTVGLVVLQAFVVIRPVLKRLQFENAELRRISAQLEESQQRFDDVVSNIPVMFYRVIISADSVVRFDYVSPRCRELNGVEPEAVMADPNLLPNLIHVEDRPRYKAETERAFSTLTPFQFEGRNVLPGGEVRWIRLESRPKTLPSGQVVWDGVHIDITEQKKAELALSENRRFTEQISTTIPDMIYVYDLIDGRNIYVNHEITDMLGYTAEQIQSLPSPMLDHLMHPDDYKRQQEEVKRFLQAKDGEVIESEYRFRHANGEYRWLMVRDTVYKRDSLGRPTQVLGIAQDITQRKHAEAERSQLMIQLEQSNQELKDFAYVVSHDLKAPLRGISSVVSWLNSDYADKLDEQGKEMLGLLIDRAKRMESLITGILEYSRVGRIVESKDEINFNALIDEIVDMLAPSPHITVTHDPDLPTLLLEPTRIRQVMQNLIDNAIKFQDKPEGRVYIGCKHEPDRWHFTVEDNGMGIEERHFGKIFQIFQTLGPRENNASTGIGLAIVKRIIEYYGGTIWVESTVGKGTTFHFTLPDARLEMAN